METSMQKLHRLLKQLPAVGEKTATRLVYHILTCPPDYGRALAAAIVEVLERIRPCPECGNLSENLPCDICRDPRRERSLLCVVEKVPDLNAIESSGAYRGLYHVLGGVLSPLDGRGPAQLNTESLLRRLPGEFREVILATGAGVEGEATALYLKEKIEPLGLKVSRIASGIPVGGELEYVDRSTLGLALAGRRQI